MDVAAGHFAGSVTGAHQAQKARASEQRKQRDTDAQRRFEDVLDVHDDIRAPEQTQEGDGQLPEHHADAAAAESGHAKHPRPHSFDVLSGNTLDLKG